MILLWHNTRQAVEPTIVKSIRLRAATAKFKQKIIISFSNLWIRFRPVLSGECKHAVGRLLIYLSGPSYQTLIIFDQGFKAENNYDLEALSHSKSFQPRAHAGEQEQDTPGEPSLSYVLLVQSRPPLMKIGPSTAHPGIN